MGPSSHIPSNLSDGITAALSSLLDRGWQPADVVHLVRRHLTQRASRLALAAVAQHSRTTDAPHRAPLAWVAQLEALGVYQRSDDRIVGGHPDIVPRWAKAEKLHPDDAHDEAAEVYRVLAVAPSLEPIGTPPQQWGATNIGLAADTPLPDVDDKVLRTIRALLAKAEGTEFEAEADAFTAKAQELMTRHSIDLAMLAAAAHSPGGTPGVVAKRIHLESPYADEKSAFLATIAEVNGVKCVWSQWCGFNTLIGFPIDLQLTEVLFTSLLVQATQASNVATARDRRLSTPSFKRAFIVSYADRIAERLHEAHTHTNAQATAHYGSALAPVLASKQEAVDAAFHAAFPDVTYARQRSYNAAGWWAGRAAADRADLGTGAALPRPSKGG